MNLIRLRNMWVGLFIAILLCNINPINAQQAPDKVVRDFGEALSSLCETKNFTYREKIKALCSGKKSCRVENKMHTEYQKKRGLTGYETFVLESYLGMFKELIHNGVDYQMYNVKLEHSDMMPDGLLSFVTADVKVSGAVNKTETSLFLVRGDKISGIYSYSSKLSFSHLNGSLIKAIELGRYIWTSGFRDGYAIVENEAGNYGLIDLKGDVIIPCMWDAVSYSGGASFATGLDFDSKIRVTYDLRKNGKRVPFHEVLTYSLYPDRVLLGGLVPTFGYMPFVFSEGWAVVRNKEGKCGFLKEDWEESEYNKIEYLFDEVPIHFIDGYAYARYEDYGVILNRDLNIVLCDNDKYHIESNVCEGLVKVSDKSTGKYGFMNLSGKLIIPCIYEYVENFSNGVTLAYSNRFSKFSTDHTPMLKGPLRLIDSSGRNLSDCDYFVNALSFDKFRDGCLLLYKKHEGKYLRTLAGSDGKPLPGFRWDHYYLLQPFYEGYALFSNNNTAGYYNKSGKIVIDLKRKYTDVSYFINGFANVGIEYDKSSPKVKWGCINKEGINIIPCIYDNEFVFNEDGIALVRKDGRIGLIDVYGNSTFFHGHISKEDNINKE